MDVDPAEILAVIFGGIAIITWMSLHYGRRIAEINAQKNSAANPAEIHALRHEVASLRQAVGDLMWQMENQKTSKQSNLRRCKNGSPRLSSISTNC